MMRIPLQDFNKLSLVKRVQELERRGFSCVVPIWSERKRLKEWNYRDNAINPRRYVGTDEQVIHRAIMEREWY